MGAFDIPKGKRLNLNGFLALKNILMLPYLWSGNTVNGQDGWVRSLFLRRQMLSAKHSVVHDYQTHRTPRMSLRFQHATL